jgi:hypothetical protein
MCTHARWSRGSICFTATEKEAHHLTHNLELAAIVHAVEICRHYLMGKRCELYTDHKSLKYIFTQSNLNLRRRRLLELIRDYDFGVNYHLEKANVVVGALSRRSHVSQLVVDSLPSVLCEEFDTLNVRIIANTEAREMEVGSSLLQEIQRGQLEDETVQEIKHNIKEEKSPGFSEDDDGVLWYKGRICVPNVKELKDKIIHEAHESAYSIHPRGNKMYHDLKATYWWYGVRETLPSMLPFATLVSESKSSINDMLDCYSHCKCPSGSGKRLPWILSWASQELSRAMIPFG